MLRALLLVLLLSNLTGCASWFKKQEGTAIIVPEKVNISPEALEACKPLKELSIASDDTAPFVTVLENIKDNAVLYADCAKKQQNSIELLRKFSNSDKDKK